MASIRGLLQKLEQIHAYLNKVVSGQIPANHQVMYHLQDVLSLVPDLIPLTKELVIQYFVLYRIKSLSYELYLRSLISHNNQDKSFHIETHDQLLPVYLSSLVRSIVALHCLINNKISNAAGDAPTPPVTASEKKKEVAAK